MSLLLISSFATATTPDGPTFADWVTNPKSQDRLAVYVDLPKGLGPFPAVVLMPGGRHESHAQDEGKLDKIIDSGIALVRWDPDGRGRSSGEDDFNGPNIQAGLAAVIRYAIARPDIIDTKVGLISWSFGISASVGALANYHPGAAFLLDYEGPPDRSWLGTCKGEEGKKQSDCSAGNDAYWEDREAYRRIGQIGVPYQRVQWIDGHGPDSNEKEESLILPRLAMEAGNPYVRVNGMAFNTPLSVMTRLTPPPGDIKMYPQIAQWCWDLFNLTSRH